MTLWSRLIPVLGCVLLGIAIWFLPTDATEKETVSKDQLEINKAIALVQSGDNPMQGILMLKQLEQQLPENLDVKYHLGIFSSVTGQYEKAIPRLEVVCGQERYQEACLYLAGAYLAINDTTSYKKLAAQTKEEWKDEKLHTEIKELLLNH